jgi:hypothetical protein
LFDKISADEVVIPVDKVTPAGEQILEEVSSFLEKRLAEKLPEPPATQEAPKLEQARAQIKQMVALAAACSQAVREKQLKAKRAALKTSFPSERLRFKKFR